MHLTALSGGLDSRMTSVVAHELGYTNQLNITFSQSGYLDQSIAQQIASDLGHEWLFKSLDTGRYLTDIDETTEYTGGNVMYYGIAHGQSLLDLLDVSKYDLIHTGDIGDVIVGALAKKHTSWSTKEGAFDTRLLGKVKFDIDYPNGEIGRFCNRYPNGIVLSSHIKSKESFESYAPFLDKDFLDFCLHLPLEYRAHHYIYKKWIIAKHPLAAKYVWEKTKTKITEHTVNILGRNLPVSQVPKGIYNKLKRIVGLVGDPTGSKWGMNPHAYYIEHNEWIKSYLDNYFNSTIDLIIESELKTDVMSLYQTGSAIEKIMALSLLSAVKRFKLQ